MEILFKGIRVAGVVWILMSGATAVAAPCLMVTLTGTQSGPVLSDGRAGSGTLVRYGDDSNNCGRILKRSYCHESMIHKATAAGCPG